MKGFSCVRIVLTSLTWACKLINDHVRIRLPIQLSFLELILDKVDLIYAIQPYLCRVFKAIFVAGYYGLLRISEVAAGPHQILAHNVHIGINKDKILFVLLMLITHNKGNLPQIVKITGLRPFRSKKYCLFQIIRNFVEARCRIKEKWELFFIFSD